MTQKFAVAGGGMAGLYYAAELQRLHPGAEVHLVESAPTLGGTYNSIRYPGDRIFDYGMHLIYEACDERVDRVVREVLGDDEWYFWEDNRKDVAGLYWNGRLQQGSHYVDLREAARTDSGREMATGLFATLDGREGWKSAGDCAAYFRSKFGPAIAEQVLGPAHKKLWHLAPEALDPFAIRMVSTDRVVLYDHEVMLDLMKSEGLRARLAIPDQRRLPPGLRPQRQRALYPRRYGMAHYIERFAAKLAGDGVKVHLGAKIATLGPSPAGKPTLGGTDAACQPIALEVDRIYWAAPLMQLAQVLKADIRDLPMDPPHHIGYAHFVFDRPPSMGDLYYFYCYDPPYRAFRVTHYAAFCPGAERDGHAVCVEMHYPAGEDPPDQAAVLQAARNELASMGVIQSTHREQFAGAHVSRMGFPRPTIANRRAFGEIRARVARRLPQGLVVGGVAPDLGRFFLQDILAAAADQLAAPAS